MPTPLRRKLRLLSIANLKGGVGKSTTTMMLAETFAVNQKSRVLIVDLDPQASCSQMFLGADGLHAVAQSGRTVTGWVDHVAAGKPRKLSSFVVSNVCVTREVVTRRTTSRETSGGDIAIFPGTPGLRFAELDFDYRNYSPTDAHAPRRRMAAELLIDLSQIERSYDLVIFDCPPAFSTLAQAAISISDGVISPILEEPLSLWGLQAFRDFGLKRTLEVWNPARHRALFTRVQSRGSLIERSELREAMTVNGFRTLATGIPESGQARRWTRLPERDRPVSFAAKYGRLRTSVEALGEETALWLQCLPHNGDILIARQEGATSQERGVPTRHRRA